MTMHVCCTNNFVSAKRLRKGRALMYYTQSLFYFFHASKKRAPSRSMIFLFSFQMKSWPMGNTRMERGTRTRRSYFWQFPYSQMVTTIKSRFGFVELTPFLVGSPMANWSCDGLDKEWFRRPLWVKYQVNSSPSPGWGYRGPALEPGPGRVPEGERLVAQPEIGTWAYPPAGGTIGVHCVLGGGQERRPWWTDPRLPNDITVCKKMKTV